MTDCSEHSGEKSKGTDRDKTPLKQISKHALSSGNQFLQKPLST